MPDLQEVLALTVVLLVVALALWRRWRRRRGNSGGACGKCAAPGDGKKPQEVPLRFHGKRRSLPPE